MHPSPATIQIIHAVLSSSCKRALRLGLVQTNVCRDVERLKVRRSEVEIFTPSEVAAILSVAQHDPLEAFWVLSLSCGLRQSEIIGLQVRDYDAAKGTLDIRRIVYNNAVGTPKSRRGRRTLKLPRLAHDALSRHTEGMGADAWMFANGAGNPIRNNTFVTRLWRPFLERVGIQYRNFHTCRHYVASTILASSQPISAASRYMGIDENTLLSTYSHLMPDQMAALAAALDAAIDGNTP